MPTPSKHRIPLLVGALTVSSIAACARARPAQSSLLSVPLLEHAGLRMIWHRQLPIRPTETLDRIELIEDRLISLSSENHMFSLDRNTGRTVFAKSIAPAGVPLMGLTPYEKDMISVTGGHLVEINGQTGSVQRSAQLAYGVVCPVARNSDFFYISGTDKRIHVLRADDRVQTVEISADNDSLITSVIAGGAVLFGTEAGNVVAAAPDRPMRLWQFDAGGPLAGAIVSAGGAVYFASKDTNVYRIDPTGRPRPALTWKHQTEAVLDESPRVGRMVVYQHVPGKGLTALDRQTGRFLWFLPGGRELLTETEDRAYIVTMHKTLAVMDNLTGAKLYTVNFAPVSKYVTNLTDSKIYVADRSARICCLEPVP